MNSVACDTYSVCKYGIDSGGLLTGGISRNYCAGTASDLILRVYSYNVILVQLKFAGAQLKSDAAIECKRVGIQYWFIRFVVVLRTDATGR